MASTISTPITARIPNSQAAELRQLAAAQGQTVSSIIASLVASNLPELRSAA
jgi:hypothetical protein